MTTTDPPLNEHSAQLLAAREEFRRNQRTEYDALAAEVEGMRDMQREVRENLTGLKQLVAIKQKEKGVTTTMVGGQRHQQNQIPRRRQVVTSSVRFKE